MQTLNAVVSTFIALAKLPKCRPVNHTWSVWNRFYILVPSKKMDFTWIWVEQMEKGQNVTDLRHKQVFATNDFWIWRCFTTTSSWNDPNVQCWSPSVLMYIIYIYIQHNIIFHEWIDNTSCNINICTIWYLMARKSMNLVVQNNTSWVGSQTRKINSVELWSLEGDGDAQPDFFKRIG